MNYDDAFAELKQTALQTKAERDRYEAALRKIAEWRGYDPAPTWFDSDVPLTDYENGANDMLETLAGVAKKALS